MNLKDLKLNDIIKIAVTVAITAALTFNIQVTITNNNYNKLASDVQDVKETTEIKVNETIDRLNQLGNNSKLSDQQILQIVKQILKEVK